MAYLVRFPLSLLLMAATLVFEVVLAIALYMYLELEHRSFFGTLVSYAADASRAIADALEAVAPNLFVQANTSFLGEVSPKAFLLLFLGLFASSMLRLLVWTIRGLRAYLARRAQRKRHAQ